MGHLNPIQCSFEKIRSQKNISYKEKDLINKVKWFSDIEVIKNFYSDLPKITLGGNQITNKVYSPRIS